jgi:hypothetical protein
MASLVSSERAFSQGGITISKRRSRLKGDIVEALQCVKCAIRHDLLFREVAPSSVMEAEWNEEEDDSESTGDVGDLVTEEKGWDELIIVDDDEDGEVDSDNSDLSD